MRTPELMFFACCLAILTALPGQSLAGQAGEFKTAAELREACAPFVKPFRPKYRRELDPDDKRLFIVNYLGSEQPEIRKAAADILAQLVYYWRRIRAAGFEKYLSKDYPLDVRVVALAYSMWNWRGGYHTDAWARLKDKWGETLNDVAECPVTVPHLLALAVALETNTYGGKWVQLLKEENHEIMIKRFLTLMSARNPVLARKSITYRVTPVVWTFPRKTLVKAAMSWYRTEPSIEARWALIELIAGRGSRTAEQVATVRPLLELAAKDLNEKILAAARKALKTK